MHSPGHVADTDEQAREELWPHYQAMHDRIGAERGWPPITAASSTRTPARPASLYVGSPETVAAQDRRDRHATLGAARFDLKYSAGTLPHELMMRSIELYGTEVVPMVHEEIDRVAA